MASDELLSYFRETDVTADDFGDFTIGLRIEDGELIKSQFKTPDVSLGPWEVVTSKYLTNITANQSNIVMSHYSDGSEEPIGPFKETTHIPITLEGTGLLVSKTDEGVLTHEPIKSNNTLAVNDNVLTKRLTIQRPQDYACMVQRYRNVYCPNQNGITTRRMSHMEVSHPFVSLHNNHTFTLKAGTYRIRAYFTFQRAFYSSVYLREVATNALVMNTNNTTTNTGGGATNVYASMNSVLTVDEDKDYFFQVNNSGAAQAAWSGGIGSYPHENNPDSKYAHVDIWKVD